MSKRLSREESRRRTRARLLEAAAEVFARCGFHSASVDEVAEAAGFSKGAVYSNFGGKDDLFLALLDQRFEQDVPEWEHAYSKRPQDARREAIEDILTKEPRAVDWTMLELEFFLYAMRSGEARENLAARYERVRESISTTLSRHYAELDVPPPAPPDVLAWLLPALAMGLQVQQGIEPEGSPTDLWAPALRLLLGEAQHEGKATTEYE